jgi:hypothetical protein
VGEGEREQVADASARSVERAAVSSAPLPPPPPHPADVSTLLLLRRRPPLFPPHPADASTLLLLLRQMQSSPHPCAVWAPGRSPAVPRGNTYRCRPFRATGGCRHRHHTLSRGRGAATEILASNRTHPATLVRVGTLVSCC